MTNVVMAAGVDTSRDFNLQFANIVLGFKDVEMLGNVLGDRDGSRGRQGAIIHSRASDNI